MGRLEAIDEDAAPASILAPTALPDEIVIKEVVLYLQAIYKQWWRELEALPKGALGEKSAYKWALTYVQGDLRKLELLQKVTGRTGESDATNTVDGLIVLAKGRIADIPRNSRHSPECQQIQARLMTQVQHTFEGMR